MSETETPTEQNSSAVPLTLEELRVRHLQELGSPNQFREKHLEALGTPATLRAKYPHPDECKPA